jgi:hypothetical protein
MQIFFEREEMNMNIIQKIRDWLGLDEEIVYFNGFDVKTTPKNDKVMTTAELTLKKKDRENAR